MTVKDLIKQLERCPQKAEVYFMSEDNGLYDVAKVMVASPDDEELRGIIGRKVVIIE